jgi:hypothetical protein
LNPAERILRTLGRHLEGPAQVRLLGGAALILGYGLDRATEDADLLVEERELELLVAKANFGAAVETTNQELEPYGLYLSHIWAPEQQILTPEWKASCRRVDRDWGTERLSVSVLGPLDLILSKLCRADDQDLDDIRHLIRVEHLDRAAVETAIERALVPPVFADVFAENRGRALALFDSETGGGVP